VPEFPSPSLHAVPSVNTAAAPVSSETFFVSRTSGGVFGTGLGVFFVIGSSPQRSTTICS
jgi:hypothetical protein